MLALVVGGCRLLMRLWVVRWCCVLLFELLELSFVVFRCSYVLLVVGCYICCWLLSFVVGVVFCPSALMSVVVVCCSCCWWFCCMPCVVVVVVVVV